MNLPQRGSDWGGFVTYVVLSLGLYFLGAVDALFFLFAIPLQILYLRRGRAQFVLGSIVVLVGIALLSLWHTASLASGGLRLLLLVVEVVAAMSIVAGVYIVNTDVPRMHRTLYRFLLATGLAGLVSLPFVVILAGNKDFAAFMHNQVQQVVKLLSSFGGTGQSTGSEDVGRLTDYVRQMALGNYLFIYFLILLSVWRIGVLFEARRRLRRPAPLAKFVLPAAFMWPILVVWGGVLADRLLHLGAFGYIVWNLAMIGAFLYGLQGLGIVQHLFARYNVARGLRALAVVVVLFLLLIPGVATIVCIVFPILGISELWIHYGRGASDKE